MKMTNDYQLRYEGSNTAGKVAQMNVRDYLLIIGQLPLPLRNRVQKINQRHLIDSMLRARDYTYTNYRSAVYEVNRLLKGNHDILNADKNLFDRIDQALAESHDTVRKGNDKMNYADFKQQVDKMMAQGHIQAAIQQAIHRYGLSKVDDHCKTIHIHRNDQLHYYYYPDELSGAQLTEPKDFEVEDVIARCEYQ